MDLGRLATSMQKLSSRWEKQTGSMAIRAVQEENIPISHSAWTAGCSGAADCAMVRGEGRPHDTAPPVTQAPR